ncbi:hypothetical protein FB566_2965 [Stackebrandtia endophytica]|uniref:Uncharacterized protein n=1 Tax=Stackebrandtia endophytica TaxID=1496996 RepID=A0A543AXW9_9ACTN|nr:hypothetical protein [Stackebrandtia endophytica]TQL77406.1 hypothetical protein FB566_2965 [Stackebrandtia endophytica]
MSGEQYLAALRELDGVRNTQADAVSVRTGRRAELTATMDRLGQRLIEQRDGLNELAHATGLPTVPAHPRPSQPPADPMAEVAVASGEVDTAAVDLDQAWFLAHRPALLPRWRADERNGLIYGIAALISLIIQVLVLVNPAGTGFTDRLWGYLICLVLPLAAFGVGWLAIGTVSRPRLGGEEANPLVKLPRNPRLGMTICLSTWVVSCALGNFYL